MSRTKRLDRLTAAQEAQLPAIRDKWLAVGLSTARADRARAEAAVKVAYERAGLAPPALLIWLDSPFAGAIGAAYLRALLKPPKAAQVWAQVRDQVWDQVRDQVGAQVWDQVWAQVRAQVWAQVRDQVWAQVRDQVWDQVRDQVRDQVWDQVWDQVRDQVRAQVRDQVRAQVMAQVWDQVRAQVRDQVWAQVGDQVRDQVRAQVRDQVWDQVGAAGYGQHDANWIGWIDAFRQFGLSGLEKVDGLTSLTESCGWWWPFAGAVILTERHNALRRDDRGRLHSADAAAVCYPDGWSIYAWHGVRVAEAVILHPESITVAQIQAEPNAEIRRVLLERYGFDRYLADSGALPVHADEVGTLYRCDLEGDEPLVVVSVTNSTPEPDGSFKRYQLRVPPTMQTAREAIAWTFDMAAKDYHPVIET